MDWNVINGVLRAVVPGLLGYLVGKGLISQSDVGEITAAIVTLAAAGWSVYTNYVKQHPQQAQGSGTATTLTVMLVIVGTLALSPPARAQTPPNQLAQGLQAIITNVQNAINGVINQLDNYTTADLNAAIAFAKAHNDTVGATCWTTLLGIVPPQIPQGAGAAFYKEVYLSLAAQYVSINENCQAAAPAFVRAYNLAIQQLTALNL